MDGEIQKEEGDRGWRKGERGERWRNGEEKRYRMQNMYTRKHLLFSQTLKYGSKHLISIGKVTYIVHCKNTTVFKFMFHLEKNEEKFSEWGQKIIYTQLNLKFQNLIFEIIKNIMYQAVITHDLKNRYQVLYV